MMSVARKCAVGAAVTATVSIASFVAVPGAASAHTWSFLVYQGHGVYDYDDTEAFAWSLRPPYYSLFKYDACDFNDCAAPKRVPRGTSSR
jgi:hypothetical protein